MPSSAFLAAAPPAPPRSSRSDGGVSPRSAPWIVGRIIGRPFTDDLLPFSGSYGRGTFLHR